MTEAIFKVWETNRKIYLDYLNKYSIEQLNTIPTGFKNNLIWNIGHIIVAQQSLTYRLAGLDMYVTNELYDTYKSGTVPSGHTTQAEIDELKTLLMSLIETTKADVKAGKFTSYTERLTGTGFLLSNVNDAFEFNNYHEGMHLGVMMGIRKFL